MTNILLVDQQQMVCQAMDLLLKKHKLRVIASVFTGQQALSWITDHPINSVIVNCPLPDVDDVVAIRQWLQVKPTLGIIGMSQTIVPAQVTQLLQIGIKGYVSQCSPIKELLHAIEQVAKNEVYLCPLVAHKIALHKTTNQDPTALLLDLSEREREVMQLIVQGQSVAEIAAKLFISAKTVCSYRYRLFAKVGVKNDVELTRFALQHQWVTHLI
ncbi:MAG: response regulator [Legionellales bacterium]|nr:response regulator [Legionellales bacterium]